MKYGLLSGKVGPWGAAIYVDAEPERLTGIGWTTSRMYPTTHHIDQAFDRVREQMMARARDVDRT